MKKMTKAQRKQYEELCRISGVDPQLEDDAPREQSWISVFIWLGTSAILTLTLAAWGINALFGLNVFVALRDYQAMQGSAQAAVPTPDATPPPLGVNVVQAAERAQVPMPVLPTPAPAPPVPEPPTAVPTPLPLPTAEILPQPTQPAAVTVVALPPLYQHPDTGNLYPSGPTATIEPLPTPPPPVPPGEYRVVWVADPAGGQKECVVYDNRRACSFAGIQPGSVAFLAGALESGLMPGEPHDASQEVTP